jgi:hypothetical protein
MYIYIYYIFSSPGGIHFIILFWKIEEFGHKRFSLVFAAGRLALAAVDNGFILLLALLVEEDVWLMEVIESVLDLLGTVSLNLLELSRELLVGI